MLLQASSHLICNCLAEICKTIWVHTKLWAKLLKNIQIIQASHWTVLLSWLAGSQPKRLTWSIHTCLVLSVSCNILAGDRVALDDCGVSFFNTFFGLRLRAEAFWPKQLNPHTAHKASSSRKVTLNGMLERFAQARRLPTETVRVLKPVKDESVQTKGYRSRSRGCRRRA